MGGFKLLKVLIADDNINFDISLVNYIREKKLDYIKFEGICTTGLKAFNKIKELKPDVLILDVQMPDMNGFKVIENLIMEKIDLPIILLVTGFSNLLNDFSYKNIIYGFLFKPFDFSLLVNYLEKIHTENKESNLHHKIIKCLEEFDFNINSLGYLYLIDCIELCLENPSYIYNLEKNVYPEVSRLHHISNYSNIKWAIEKCIKSMSRYTKTEVLNNFFPGARRISPKIFIKNILASIL